MSSPEAAPAVQPAVKEDAETRRLHRVELLATVLLAVAAVATAWSTFQSTRWRGEQAIDFSKANAARIHSSQAATRAGQLTKIDIALFGQWVKRGGRRQAAARAVLPPRVPARLRGLGCDEAAHKPERSHDAVRDAAVPRLRGSAQQASQRRCPGALGCRGGGQPTLRQL